MKTLFISVLSLFFSITPVAAQDTNLTILSPHWEGIRYEFEWAFQDYYRGRTGKEISFTWLDVGGTSQILRFIQSEFDRKPDGINVDMFFGGGVEPYEELSRLHLLQPYTLPPEILDEVPAQIAGAPLMGKDHTWYAPVLGSFGILCNDEVLKIIELPPPQTWEDVTRPQYHSWVASTDPRKSGSGHMIYEIILQAYGWDKGWDVLFGIGRNIRSFSDQSNQPAKDVEAGEVACAFAYDTQAWWAQQKYGQDKMPFILPEGLTVVVPDAVGILRGAPHPKEAGLFLEFLMSPPGQRLWIRPKGSHGGPRTYDLARMPVLPGIYSESGEKLVHFNPFTWRNAFDLNAEKAAKRWNVLNDLLGTFIVESHQLLRELPQGAPFPQVPSEQDAVLAGLKWDDPVQRDKIIQIWKEECRRSFPASGRSGSLLLLSMPWAIIGVLILFRLLYNAWRKRISANLYTRTPPGVQ